MGKLKLDSIPDEKTVRLTIELTGAAHRDLVAYAEAVSGETGIPIKDASKLIGPMITKFMATDREFKKHKNATRKMN